MEEGLDEVDIIEENVINERQLIRIINVDENTYERIEYDSNGNLLTIVDNEGGFVQERRYNSENLLELMISSALIRFFAYDEQGRLEKEEISLHSLSGEICVMVL